MRLPRERLESIALGVYVLKQRKNDPFNLHREKYNCRPLDWIDDHVEVDLPRYMRKAFGAIQDGARKIAIQGPHGIGKTVFASLLILWVGTVSADCKIPTTASAWRQLTRFLWPEIHKWYGKVNWQKIGRAPELLTQEAHWGPEATAFAVACTNAATIEGAHAKRVCYVYDEAKTIPPKTWDASQGAFSTPGDHLQVALSTPADESGEFYNICSHKKGYEDWRVFHVSIREAVRSGRMSMAWARECRRRWGNGNPIYINRVWGRFAQQSSDNLIPLAWVQAAVERWHTWKDAGGHVEGKKMVGVDVSRGGADRQAIAHRQQNIITHIDYYGSDQTKDTMVTVGRILIAIGPDGKARVDVIGVGSGVVDRLKEQIGSRCIAVNAAEGIDITDRSGELKFANVRAAMWWNAREMLDPANNENVCLPDDPELMGDLTTPKWKPNSSGKILIQSKDEIRIKLGRSTDAGDAVVEALFDSLKIPEYVTVG